MDDGEASLSCKPGTNPGTFYTETSEQPLRSGSNKYSASENSDLVVKHEFVSQLQAFHIDLLAR